MPKTKRKRSAPHERPYVSDLELHDALQDKLTVRELNALEKQIRKAVEIACNQTVAASVEETYKRHWAVTIWFDLIGYINHELFLQEFPPELVEERKSSIRKQTIKSVGQVKNAD